MEAPDYIELVEKWNQLLADAVTKWLQPERMLFALVNFKYLNIPVNTSPPISPSNGQVYVYDREKTKNFKLDGVNWTKRKNENRIQETYETFDIGDLQLHRVNSRSADDSNFQKRMFRLTKCNSNLVIVHYRYCTPSVTEMDENTAEGGHKAKSSKFVSIFIFITSL